MKKLLSIILAVIMIVTTIPFAFAAGDDAPLTIDLSEVTSSYISIGNGRTYYDEDGYIITGTNTNVEIVIYDSCDITFRNMSANDVCLLSNTEENVTVTLDGDNYMEGCFDVYRSHLTINGDDDDTLTIESSSFAFTTSGNSGTLTVNGGKINAVIETTDNCPTISCAGGFTLNGGEVTASNDYYHVISNKTVINDGTLNVISTSPDREAIIDDIEIAKGALLTVSATHKVIRSTRNITPVNEAEEKLLFFARFDKDSDFAIVSDIKVALDGKNYAEIKVDTHEHSGGTATCVGGKICELCKAEYGEVDADAHDWSNKDGVCANACGFECPHESITDGTCDDCGYACPHENYTDGVCDVCGCVCPHENNTGATQTCGGYQCEVCGTFYGEGTGEHVDEDGNSICDLCSTRIFREIKPDDTYTVTKEELVKFIPAVSGNHIISSVSDVDPRIKLYNSNMEYITEEDDSGYREENDLDFYLEYEYTAGETYYFEFYDYNGEYNYTVTIIEPCSVHTGGTQTCKGFKCEVCERWYGEAGEQHDLSTEQTCEGYKCNLCYRYFGEKGEHSPSTEQTCKGYWCKCCYEWFGEADTSKHNWYYGYCNYCRIEYPVDEECTHDLDDNGECRTCGYQCPHDTTENGACTSCSYLLPFSLTIGETVTYHSSFSDALDKAEDGATVKVLKDNLSMPNLIINKAIILDLNGKVWESEYPSVRPTCDVNAGVTFTDSVGGGYLAYTVNLNTADAIFEDGSYVVICIYHEGSTFGDYLAPCKAYYNGEGELLEFTNEDYYLGRIEIKDNHNLGTQTCKGYKCEDCGEWFGEADPDAHDWIRNILVRPKRNTDGSWTDGYYYDKCKNDEAHNVLIGIAKRADYTAYDNACAKLSEYFSTVEFTDAAVEEIRNTLALTTMVPNNLVEGESSLAFMNNWVKSAETIIAKIESGEYVKVDNTEIAEVINAIAEVLETAKISEEMKNELIDIKTQLEPLKENENLTMADVIELYKRLDAITKTMENCANGIHSFTKYEEVEAPECGVVGKEVAECDNGCGETDEQEIPATEHQEQEDYSYDYTGHWKNCVYDCGTEIEGTRQLHTYTWKVITEATETTAGSEKGTCVCGWYYIREIPATGETDTDCDHLCHKTGFVGFIWKIISFLQRLFGIQQYCDCGVLHYEKAIFG